MFYKQGFIKPNEKAISQRLANHSNYIAKNSKCKIVLNDGKEHGLFGNIGNTGLKDIDSLGETVQYILEKSTKDKINIYNGMISLSADEIKRANFESRKKWERMINSKIHVIAKENDIKIQNLEWVGAYHVKKKQSHCHIVFWDKNEQIKEPYINKTIFAKKMERIKGAFAKVIFQEDFTDLYKMKDEALANLNSELSVFFSGDISEEEANIYKKMFAASSVDLSDHDMINPYFTKRQRSIVLNELLRIKELLPKTGSLKYGYQTAEVKREIDKAVLSIISCSKDCRKAYNKYIQSAIEIRKIYADNPSSLGDAKNEAIKNVNKNVGNKIMKVLKEFKKIESNVGSANQTKNTKESENIQKDNAINNLITQIAFSLSSGANSTNDKIHTIVHDDLSKQAKVELAKKMRNKGVDWGQYER